MTTPTTATRGGARERTRAAGTDLKAAYLAASKWLEVNAERINALNVFPVPDGDTGTNMSMTLGATAEALQRLPGFAQGLAAAERITPPDLARALVLAGEIGYTAVSKPVEGTILTVARE